MYFWLSRICLKNKDLPTLLLCSLGTTKTKQRTEVMLENVCMVVNEERETLLYLVFISLKSQCLSSN